MTAAACASAPLNFSTAPEISAPASAHSQFHAACDAVVETVDTEGLTLVEERGAEALFSRLLVGGGEDEPATPLERYAESHALESTDAEALGHALTADAAAAADRVARAAVIAATVLESEMYDPAVLGRDIAAAERALAASRRAQAFLIAARDELDAAGSESLNAAVARLAEETEQLAARADGIAERRWAVMQGEVS